MCHECDQITAEAETLVMLAEASRLVIDAEAKSGASVPGAVRPLLPHEIQAQVRFGEIDDLTGGATAEANQVLTGLRDVIVGSVMGEMLGDADTVTPADAGRALAQLNAAQPVPVQEAVARTATALQGILSRVASGATSIVTGEATRQGVKLPADYAPPAVDPELFRLPAAAAALHPWQRITGKLQSSILNPSNLYQAGISRESVAKELDSIPLDGAMDMARQTIHSAHGIGRNLAAAALNPTEWFASEIMDGNTCAPCARIDGKAFRDEAEANQAYPNGGYDGCLGGTRCRGTLVFMYDEPATNPDPSPDPLPPIAPRPKPDLPPEPPKPHVEAVNRIKAQLPADMSKFGFREETLDFDAALADATADMERRMGGTLADLKANHAAVKAKLDDWDALNQHVISYIPAKWPDEAKPLVKKLGFGRKGPAAVAKLLADGRYSLWEMEMDASSKVAQLERALSDLPDYVRKYKLNSRTVDDLTVFGKLGKETEKVLDSVLDAGKVLDDELQTRVAARLADLGDKPALVHDLQRINGKRRKIMIERAGADDARFLELNNELAGLDAEAKKIADAVAKIKDAQGSALREEALKLLAEVRGVGAGGRSKYKGIDGFSQETARAMETAHSYFPDDWNDRLAKYRPNVEVGENQRGYNSGGGLKIMLSRDYDHKGTGPLGHVAVHELGHSMEAAIPGLQGLEWALHYRRSQKVTIGGVDSLKPAYDLYGQNIGHGNEMVHRDDWALSYTGKTYRRGDRVGAQTPWEIFTTGVESVFEGSPYFTRGSSVGDDVEFRRFILGVMSVL